nr:MAG TPA: hypothetical protein [Caudoviricetes sp.]
MNSGQNFRYNRFGDYIKVVFNRKKSIEIHCFSTIIVAFP